jgi:hypothetical protein
LEVAISNNPGESGIRNSSEYKGGKQLKKLLAIGAVMALVGVMAAPMAALAETSGDTTVTANTESATLSITAPNGKAGVTLLLNKVDQSLLDSTGSVTSNVPYTVTAADKMDSKIGDAGKMVEWTASAWGMGKILDPVKVGSTMPTVGQAPSAIGATAITIISNAPPALTPTDCLISATVSVGSEPVLPPGSVYKVVITFTVSQGT